MTGVIEFTFPAPAERLSLNQRLHPMARYRLEKTWRDAVMIHARQHQRTVGFARPLPSCVVHVEFCCGTNRRRDVDNAAATLKPILDSLVAERWLVDDSSEWVQTSVGFTVDKTRAGQVTVRLTPKETS